MESQTSSYDNYDGYKNIAFKMYLIYLKVKGKYLNEFCGKGSVQSFSRRRDKTMFYRLTVYLMKSGISTESNWEDFFIANSKFFGHLYLYELVSKVAVDNYRKYRKKQGTVKKYINTLKKELTEIENFVIIHNMKWNEFLNVGTPPIIIKLYKKGKIDDAIVVASGIVSSLKRNKFYKFYVPELIKNEGVITDRLKLLTFVKDRISYLGEKYE